jgi:MOSC domain-containing protein YiiM
MMPRPVLSVGWVFVLVKRNRCKVVRWFRLILSRTFCYTQFFLDRDITAEQLRRNIVVEGFNLLSLAKKHFEIDGVVLQMTGLCHPCSLMKEVLGYGGYNAMRGHSGITATVITAGEIRRGASIRALLTDSEE